MAREFYQQIGKHYGQAECFNFEPHIAAQVFKTGWLRRESNRILTNASPHSKKDGRRISQ
jgi:hypothetical protein